MKNLLFIFFVFTINNSYTQTNLINVPEVWEIDVWDGSSWDLTSQVTFTFNSKCLATEGLSKVIDFGGSNMLENSSFLTFTYNANDLPIESINQLWDENTSMWEDQLKTEFIYSGTNLTEFINYDWLNDNWEQTNRELNTYNASNLVIENTSQTWDETNSIWLNISKIEYTYNPNDTFNIVTTYSWNPSNSTWENDIRETHTYTGNLLTSKKADVWNTSMWENDRIRNYTYDNDDFLIETLKTKWNGSVYENDNRILRTNNSDGFPTEMINQTWFFGSWLNGTRDRRTYPDCEALSTEEIVEAEFKIYPNPVKNEVTIQSKINGFVSIIDMNGRQITSINIENNIHILDTSKLNNGVYLLIFQNENRKRVKRLVIEK